jgi:hypothetical protein
MTQGRTIVVAVLTLVLSGLFLASVPAQTPQDPTFRQIESAWKRGDGRELGPLLANRVHLQIGSHDGTYGRRQATVALVRYFETIQVESFRRERTEASYVTYAHRFRTASGEVQTRKVYIHLTREGNAFRIDDITQYGR